MVVWYWRVCYQFLPWLFRWVCWPPPKLKLDGISDSLTRLALEMWNGKPRQLQGDFDRVLRICPLKKLACEIASRFSCSILGGKIKYTNTQCIHVARPTFLLQAFLPAGLLVSRKVFNPQSLKRILCGKLLQDVARSSLSSFLMWGWAGLSIFIHHVEWRSRLLNFMVLSKNRIITPKTASGQTMWFVWKCHNFHLFFSIT
jgi:hypothetical protein